MTTDRTLELHHVRALGPELLGQFVVVRELRRLLRLELVEVEAGLAFDLGARSELHDRLRGLLGRDHDQPFRPPDHWLYPSRRAVPDSCCDGAGMHSVHRHPLALEPLRERAGKQYVAELAASVRLRHVPAAAL